MAESINQIEAVCPARQMVDEGADIIDVEGNPPARFDPVSAEEEIRRVMPVIEALKDPAVIYRYPLTPTATDRPRSA